MQLFERVFLMEFKKNMRNLPWVILGSALLLAVIAAFAYGASKTVFASEELIQAKVGVITNDAEDPSMQFALNYINKVESASLSLSFEIMDEREAYASLEKGDLIALLIFPDDVIGGILYGREVNIQIVFSNANSLSSVFLTELTKAGSSLLTSAQAGTYTTASLYTQLGATDSLSDAYNDIDTLNFKYALSREHLYSAEASTLNGTSSTLVFYISSALLLLLFFCGAAFAPALRRENSDFYQLLFSRQMTPITYYFAKWCSHVITILLLLLLFGLILIRIQNIETLEDLLWISKSIPSIFFVLLLSFFMASYHLFLYQLAPDSSMAILFFFVLGCLLVFLGGGIIPTAFFPNDLANFAYFLPSNRIQSGLIQCLSGYTSIPWFSMIIYSIIFYLLGMLSFILRREHNTL